MKKIISAVIVLFITYSVSAQYKKASFFGKQGRTYEFGAQLYSLGKGQGSPIGYRVGFGRDRDGKQFFSSWDLQYIPSYKYSYQTTDNYSNAQVTVNGSTSGILLYGLNYGFYLLKNDNADRKIKPYVCAIINFGLTGGIKSETITPDSYEPNKVTSWPAINFRFGGGVGCIYNFTNKFGLKLQGGYVHRLYMDYDYDGSDDQVYRPFGNYVSVSAGLRLRITKD